MSRSVSANSATTATASCPAWATARRSSWRGAGAQLVSCVRLRRDRFIDAVAVVDVFRNAPAVNWKQIRDDLDVLIDQDVKPHA